MLAKRLVLAEREVVEWLSQRNLLPSPDVVARAAAHPDGLGWLERSLQALEGERLFLGLGDLVPEPIEPRPVVHAATGELPPVIIRRQIERTRADGKLQSYVALFNDRFRTLSRLVRRDPAMRDATGLRQLEQEGEHSVVGMVAEVRPLPGGRVRVVLEDPDSRLAVMFNEPEEGSLDIFPDEVIGVSGRLSRRGDLRFVNGPVIRPHQGRLREPGRAEEPWTALFISDLHIGSGTFQRAAWDRFVAWLNGDVDYNQEWIPRPGYLVLAGDVVDGIDSYPNQETDLEITDVWEQYAVLQRELEKLPTDIQVIVLPGNHDAVRLMEPQLPLPARVQERFPPGVVFTANPALLDLAGVSVLCYHGKSFDDLVSLCDLTYDKPILMMKELLLRRHLAPVYGGKTLLAPEDQDHMLIREMPDILVTGHVHSCGVEPYHATLLLNPGTWQSQTDFQRMMGFQPDPNRAIAVNLQSFETQVLDFNR